MNKNRLLKLADLLEEDAKNKKGVKFDLGSWGFVEGLSSDIKPEAVTLDCGTRACAIGLACISGAFKRQGLRGIVVSYNGGAGNNILPSYKGKGEWAAVEDFFGLTFDEARFLFALSYYDGNAEGAAGERTVARRLRDFVAGNARP